VPNSRAPVLPFIKFIDVIAQPICPFDYSLAAMAQLAFLFRLHARKWFRLAIRDEDGIPSKPSTLHGLDDGTGTSSSENYGIRMGVRTKSQGTNRLRIAPQRAQATKKI